MEFSFQLYSARNFTPWSKVYQSISSLGYSQVEGFGDVFADAGATREQLDTADLSMPSAHFSLDALENNLESTLETARTLGCVNLFCPHIAEAQRPGDAAGWSEFGKKLNDLGKKINDKGFRFGWHNHDFEFIACTDGSIPMRSILESAPDIDWEMDAAWIARTGTDPLPWISVFGSRITAVHVKDLAVDGQNTNEDGWADIGFGTMDWKTLMQQLTGDSKNRLFIAEHDNPHNHERFASRAIEKLNSYI